MGSEVCVRDRKTKRGDGGDGGQEPSDSSASSSSSSSEDDGRFSTDGLLRGMARYKPKYKEADEIEISALPVTRTRSAVSSTPLTLPTMCIL